MFRSLHMKLVMIMLLLVTSLMAVVGAFLMTSVTNFYIDDFYEQMSEVFGESNAAFVSSLHEEAAQEDGAARLQTMLEAYSGTLSIDSRNRKTFPGCVPGSIFTFALPSMVGTSSVPPKAAVGKSISALYIKSFSSRNNSGCGSSCTRINKSPLIPP